MKPAPIKLRPAVKWHGGKTYLARPIVSLFPPHGVYVEPFAGGLSVLLNKPRCPVEVAGDLDPGLIHLYRTLTADPGLRRELRSLAYDRRTFDEAAAWLASEDGRRRAVGFLVRNRFSRGGLGRDFAWSERLRGGQPGDKNAWETFVARELDAVAARLAGVQLVPGPALDLIRRYDGPDTVIYADPPYVPSTRTAPDAYRYEMTADQHRELLRALRGCRGAVFLSGYRSPLYDEALAGWGRVDWNMPNHSGQGRSKQRRTESVWINAVASKLPKPGDGGRRQAAGGGSSPGQHAGQHP